MRDKKNALLISLVVYVLWVVVVIGGQSLQTSGETTLDTMVTSSLVWSLLLAPVLLFIVVGILRWWREVGLVPGEGDGKLRMLWLPIIYLVVFAITALIRGLPDMRTLFFVFINTLLVGISEELMFRGILYHGVRTRARVMTAVAVTAVLFGAVHILNGLITGDFGASIVQAIQASLFGVWIAAIRIRFSSLRPVIIIHWLWDFLVFLGGSAILANLLSFAGNFAAILLELPLFIYGLYLLRGVPNEPALLDSDLAEFPTDPAPASDV